MNAMMLTNCLLFAARHKSALSGLSFFQILFVFGSLLILMAILYAYYYVQNEKRKAVQADIDRIHAVGFKQWHNAVVKSGEVPPVACDLILGKGEECVWFEPNVTLYEVRAVRHSTHTFGSTSLGKGVRVGRGYSTSESTDEWRPIAEGQLYVTNKQVYFDGDKFDRKIPIGKIATIKAEWSAVEISSDTRQKSMIFFGVNGNIVRESVLCAAGQNVFTHLLT